MVLRFSVFRKRLKRQCCKKEQFKLFKISMMLSDTTSFLLIWGLISLSLFFPCFWSFILGKYVHLSCILQGKLWDVEFVIKSEDRRSFVFEVEVAQRCWAGLFWLHSLSLFKLLLLHSAFYSIEDSVTLIHLQKAQVKRLHSLLTIKDSASNIPRNLEARRRLEFFTNSLFMDMPPAKPAREMLSFWYTSILHASILYLCIWSIYLHVKKCSVFTPYYSEIVLYSMDELLKKNEDGISILFYLQKIYPGIYFVMLMYLYVSLIFHFGLYFSLVCTLCTIFC